MKIKWHAKCEEQFNTIMEQIPALIRPIAEMSVSKKAIQNAQKNKRDEVNEKDMVDAFFSETPSGFVPQMRASMEELGINFSQYGHK